MNAFQRVSATSALWAAWQQMLSTMKAGSRGTIGSDGLSVNDVKRDPTAHLIRLHAELRSGDYAPSPLFPCIITKPNGKKRVISVPTVRDRIAQRSVLNYLTGKYQTRVANAVSYGFVSGRSVEQAAVQACRLRDDYQWVFKTDITSFFDNVSREILDERIRAIVHERSLRGVLGAFASCEIDTQSRSKRAAIAQAGISRGKGVRQGMPLSPFFSNLFLDPFDRKIIARGFPAVRYADDLIFFARGEAECRGIESFCREELAKIGLTIPAVGVESKSIIVPPGQDAEFLGLGLRLNGQRHELVLLKSQIQAIRADLLQLGSIEELISRRINLGQLDRHIAARLGGYAHAYDCCTNAQELENALSDVRSKILTRVYGQGLGMSLHSLPHSRLRFLGINPVVLSGRAGHVEYDPVLL